MVSITASASLDNKTMHRGRSICFVLISFQVLIRQSDSDMLEMSTQQTRNVPVTLAEGYNFVMQYIPIYDVKRT